MKKNVYKILAAACAMTLVAASPMTSITSHAIGFNKDAGEDTTGGNGRMPDNYWDDYNNAGSGSGSPSTGVPGTGGAGSAPSYNAPSGNDSSSSNSSNSSSSNNSSSNGSSNSSAANKSAKAAIDVTVCVTGGQKFRAVINAGHTVFQVYHCGVSRVSFSVKDADGNVVSFNAVTLEQDEDKLWYEDITFSADVDTEDFTVAVTKGDANYLSEKLGVSGIKINGTLALSTVPATEEE